MPLALDIINEIAERLEWPQVESLESAILPKETRKLLRLLNRVLEATGGLEDWPMLRKEATIQLVADVVSDTDTEGSEEYIAATQNSTTITSTNSAFDSSYIGRAFQASNCDYVFRITDVPSATTLTLNRAWFQDSITAADEVTFTIAMDQYVLPTDFSRPLDDFESVFAPYNIKPTHPAAFAARRKARGNTIEVGEPEVFTIYGMNDAQTAEVLHFDPFPSDVRLLSFPYASQHPTINSDNDKILYPRWVVGVLVEVVLQLAYRDYEDDDRMQATLVQMLQQYNQSAAKKTVTQQPMIIRPNGRTRLEVYRSFAAHGGAVDWGDAFDRAGNVGFF